MSLPARARRAHTFSRQQARWTPADEVHLRTQLDAIQLKLTDEQQDRLCRWAALLLHWNRTYNLLGATSATALIEEHLIDSLAILPALSKWLPDRTQALIDVGTGAGFPGILIAIMQPERPIWLVEPIGKKVAFQRQSVLTLGLNNVTPLGGKIEDLDRLMQRTVRPPMTSTQGSGALPDGKAMPATPDRGRTEGHGSASPPVRHFICRAFTALDRFASLCEPFMSERSLAFAMKAMRLPEEQMTLSPTLRVVAVEDIRTAQPAAERYLAVMQRVTTAPLLNPEPAMQISSDSTTHRRRQA